MKLLKWLFDGPRIRGQMLKLVNELDHDIPRFEESIEYHKEKLDMRTSEYLTGRLFEMVRLKNSLSKILDMEAKN